MNSPTPNPAHWHLYVIGSLSLIFLLAYVFFLVIFIFHWKNKIDLRNSQKRYNQLRIYTQTVDFLDIKKMKNSNVNLENVYKSLINARNYLDSQLDTVYDKICLFSFEYRKIHIKLEKKWRQEIRNDLNKLTKFKEKIDEVYKANIEGFENSKSLIIGYSEIYKNLKYIYYGCIIKKYDNKTINNLFPDLDFHLERINTYFSKNQKVSANDDMKIFTNGLQELIVIIKKLLIFIFSLKYFGKIIEAIYSNGNFDEKNFTKNEYVELKQKIIISEKNIQFIREKIKQENFIDAEKTIKIVANILPDAYSKIVSISEKKDLLVKNISFIKDELNNFLVNTETTMQQIAKLIDNLDNKDPELISGLSFLKHKLEICRNSSAKLINFLSKTSNFIENKTESLIAIENIITQLQELNNIFSKSKKLLISKYNNFQKENDKFSYNKNLIGNLQAIIYKNGQDNNTGEIVKLNTFMKNIDDSYEQYQKGGIEAEKALQSMKEMESDLKLLLNDYILKNKINKYCVNLQQFLNKYRYESEDIKNILESIENKTNNIDEEKKLELLISLAEKISKYSKLNGYEFK